ncbi:hypothetical protein ACFL2A_04055, partial [Thermodesulfobacteriota bacterium]
MNDDIFTPIIGMLNDGEEVVKLIEEPIKDTVTFVTVVDDILHGVDDGITILVAVEESVTELVNGAIACLTPIPVIGEIADAADAVMEGIEGVIDTIEDVASGICKDIITPVEEVLDDV